MKKVYLLAEELKRVIYLNSDVFRAATSNIPIGIMTADYLNKRRCYLKKKNRFSGITFKIYDLKVIQINSYFIQDVGCHFYYLYTYPKNRASFFEDFCLIV